MAMDDFSGAFISSMETSGHLDGIAELRQIFTDRNFQPDTLTELLIQRSGQSCHLLLERLAIVLLVRRTHVAPRRQHVVVPVDLVELRGFAETSYVGVALALLPGVEGIGNVADIHARE